MPHALQRSLLARLTASFNRVERWLLVVLCVTTLIAGAGSAYQYWLRTTVAVPARGGTYTEGIVADSIVQIAPTLNVLTNVGFVRFDESGVIVPVAAERWEVSEDGKTYTFTIRDGFRFSPPSNEPVEVGDTELDHRTPRFRIKLLSTSMMVTSIWTVLTESASAWSIISWVMGESSTRLR